jgi:DNA-binding transcriptional MerR regulator
MLSGELTKLYYSIGEVADMLGVATSVIRYWESEIPSICPSKNSKGERRYTPKDIHKLESVFHLIKERGFTIEGAKKELQSQKADDKLQSHILKKLHTLKSEIIKLKEMLDTETN